MHVSTALDVIEKRGTFKSYTEAHALYVENCKLTKQAKAALAKLDKATSKGDRTPSRKASQKSQAGAALADAPDPELHAIYQNDLDKAKAATETTKTRKNQLQWRCSSSM
jgi:hypothetical protein